jgi:hypothetical protein
MMRLGSVALKAVLPALAVAALAFMFRGLPSTAEVDVTPTPAGRTHVAQGRTSAMTSLSAPLPDHDGIQAREHSPHFGQPRPDVDVQGDEDREQSSEHRTAPTWWWPFGERGTATRSSDSGPVASMSGPVAFIPASSTPQLSPGSGAANLPAMVQFVAISRRGETLAGDSFEVGTMRDLKILVWWSVAGQHVQRLELVSPDGSLYQRFVAAFDTDAAKLVETMLPVAGTWITDHSLFGQWTVNVYLDDAQTPFTSASFSVSS